MKVELHPAVLGSDLPGIYAYIARDNPSAADRVLDAVEATFEQITRSPECGVAYITRNHLLKNVRMLPVHGFTNYLIFYRSEQDAIRVLYVVHGARHLPRLFRREPRD